ncbi:Smr/MutS family protein [Glaciimonas soli]|uniref:DNA mismatch repair protein MutS n=1 Tax=Glaciimonas soli TaxID=2590999 RepID=A0A843YQ29_9BURK|nr:Smr/MutS family protein [Glaciimonas soli]MQQ99490.1 DNA mismatch repair protein MutS [Glaciimonas soli]
MANPIKDFRALKPLRKTLKIQHEARLEAAAEQHRQQQAKHREENLFRHVVGEVRPLKSSNKIANIARQPLTATSIPRPTPKHRPRSLTSPRDILQASLSDAYSIENLSGSDEVLRYARAGIGADVLTKLQRGHWAIRQQLDLHGLRSDQARDALAAFIAFAYQRGWRCVRIIHGKGYGSVNQQPVLKRKARDWLVQIPEVIAFCQANEADGGAGALMVLLRA